MNVLNQINEVNKSYLEQFERFLEESDNIILSGEDISILKKDPLNKLVEKIQSYGYKIHVFALVRSPYSFCCSAIQQKIKTGKYLSKISLNDIWENNVRDQLVLDLMF